jgi:hypothetical protein
MLLNFSSHSFDKWDKLQRENALSTFHEVIDMTFPMIDPAADDLEIDLLVENYFTEIKKFIPQAIHIMGELTFTYRMVSKLKNAGFHCIASTTKRNVTEKDGAKVSRFEFVKFRDY